MDEFSFLICGDTHIGGYAARAGYPTRAEVRRTQDWLSADLRTGTAAAEDAEIIVVLGDVTENGSREELSAYRRVADEAPVEIVSVFGGHDGKNLARDGDPDATRFYRELVGPLWHAFSRHGARFLARVSEERFLTAQQRAEQTQWLARELEAARGYEGIVLLQHTPPTAEDRDLFERYPIRAVLYGHQHCVKVYEDGGVLVVGAQAPNTAGFNGDPRSFVEVRMGAHEVTSRIVYLPHAARGPQSSPSSSDRPNGNPVRDCDQGAPAGGATAEWPDFYGGDTVRVCGASLRCGIALAWQTKLGGTVKISSPVASRGKIYITVETPDRGGSDLCCLDATTGSERWRRHLPSPAYHTPVLTADLVVVSTSDGALRAFEMSSGAPSWATKTEAGPDRWAFHGPGLADGDVIYRHASRPPVTTGVQEDVPVVRLCAQDGREVWRSVIRHTDWMSPFGLPLCVDGYALIPAVLGDGVSCFDAGDGTLVWNTAGLGALKRTAASLGCSLRHRLVFACGYWKHPVPLDRPRTGSLCALDLDTGELRWERETAERLNTTPVAAGDRLVLGEAGTGDLVCFDTTNGRELWRVETGASIICTSPGRRDVPSISSTPLVAGETVYVGAGDGSLYSIDLETGRELSRYALPTSIASSPALYNNALYVADLSGAVSCLKG